MSVKICRIVTGFHVLFIYFMVTKAYDNKTIDLSEKTDVVDKLIEDEITNKLYEDFLQSIEKKFQIDLQRSVDVMLDKIKMLLQNGTSYIQDNLVHLTAQLDAMRAQQSDDQVDKCLVSNQNESIALAEKSLHQMVICGYALIGHDPAQATKLVVDLKTMIKNGIEPIRNNRDDVNGLLKLCGHEHDTLKKVIKCVISKSPLIKTAMMEVTNKLIEGIIKLTKLMAHGAMHEACIIEVIKTIEDEAFELVKKIKTCAFKTIDEEVEKNLQAYNNTVDDDILTNDNEANITSPTLTTTELPELFSTITTIKLPELTTTETTVSTSTASPQTTASSFADITSDVEFITENSITESNDTVYENNDKN